MTIRGKRRICIAFGAAAVLLGLGCIGGAEMGWMSWGKGIALAALCEAVWAASWWKAGWIRWWS